MASAGKVHPSFLPSHQTIAFALAVVKSKPEGLTIREHLQRLRQHVAAGRRRDAKRSIHRHLDTDAYWHAQYRQLEQLRKQTENDNIDLRMEVELLKSQLQDSRPKTASKKRKKEVEDVAPPNAPSKRVTRSSVALQPTGILSPPGSDFDFSGVGAAGVDLVRSFYQLNSILDASQQITPEVLAQRCVAAASTITVFIRRAVLQEPQTSSKRETPLKTVLLASNRVVLALTMGYNRLSRLPGGSSLQGRLTYASVQTYAQLVDILSEMSAPSSRAKSPTDLTLMTTFLGDFFNNLKPNLQGHKALFEGYAYIVLKKVGTVLHTLVFGHVRAESIEAEILTSIPKRHEETGKLKAAEALAPFLAQLLRCMLAAAPAHLGQEDESRTGGPGLTETSGSHGGKLVDKAKVTLQNTMIQCMFGPEGFDAQNCLQMPTMRRMEIVQPRAEVIDVQEWFTDEIWKMLGWEILSRDRT